MSITLTVDTTTVTLPSDMYWADESDWHPVRQNVEYTLTGALVIDIAPILAGRPISLRPYDNAASWMVKADLDQLKTWAAALGQQMTLNLHGTAHTVIWRHQNPPALSAEPVVFYEGVDSDFYLVRLNLMKV